MLNKRLINSFPECKKWIRYNVLSNWISLLATVASTIAFAWGIQWLASSQGISLGVATSIIAVMLIGLIIRAIATKFATFYSYKASANVKHRLRLMIYDKVIELFLFGNKNSQKTAKITQLTTDGVEQLEVYFAAYIPQFYYALIAPITLFSILLFINPWTAFVLLICVPLIPLSIILFMSLAKRLFKRYWGVYINLSGSFLDNLQGLTTLKVYQDDAYKAVKMDQEASNFRNITMKVLAMQLNSITIMDMIAFGGVALGIIVSLYQFKAGNIEIFGVILFIILSSEFFIPLRALGSLFHVAMQGEGAATAIFNLLDTPVNRPKSKQQKLTAPIEIKLDNVSFEYEKDHPILNNISATIGAKKLTVFAGLSGSGKSTVAALLLGFQKSFSGTISFNGVSIKDIDINYFYKHVTIVSHSNYIFSGTVRENLLMAKPDATDDEIYQALAKVNLAGFITENGGLEFKLSNQATNLSGGQIQRLALARALLHDADVYIFDEATSSIDIESEQIINHHIHQLKQHKTVILISHRLANSVDADQILVLQEGTIIEHGNHKELINQHGVYANMYLRQKELEQISQSA